MPRQSWRWMWRGKKISAKRAVPPTMKVPINMASFIPKTKALFAPSLIDTASALDVAHRTAWRDLLDDATRRKFHVVLVFKLDRAFRSVKHMHDALCIWETLVISFKSQREQFDTSTALGRLLPNLLAALAEFELEFIRERVKAGMDRAARQGKRIGRPRVTDRRGFKDRYKTILEYLGAGEISRRRAVKELGIGYASLKRLLDSRYTP